MPLRSFTVVYEPAEAGGFYAHVPALELTTEGETLDQAKEMARDAIEGYVEAAQLIGKTIPADVRVEQIEVHA